MISDLINIIESNTDPHSLAGSLTFRQYLKGRTSIDRLSYAHVLELF